jgi:hypothetical protein
MQIHVKEEYAFDTLSTEYKSIFVLFLSNENDSEGPTYDRTYAPMMLAHKSRRATKYSSILFSSKHKIINKCSFSDGNDSDGHFFQIFSSTTILIHIFGHYFLSNHINGKIML